MIASASKRPYPDMNCWSVSFSVERVGGILSEIKDESLAACGIRSAEYVYYIWLCVRRHCELSM